MVHFTVKDIHLRLTVKYLIIKFIQLGMDICNQRGGELLKLFFDWVCNPRSETPIHI